jgi:hypothetical protein
LLWPRPSRLLAWRSSSCLPASLSPGYFLQIIPLWACT